MKYISLVLNVVLLAAVAVLYFFHFSQKPEVEKCNHVASLSNLMMAYVNSDSLLTQYIYFKNKKTSLEAKQSSIKSELSTESSRLQHEIEEYQKKAAYMTDQERGKSEEDLTMKQQRLVQKKDDMLRQLEEEQDKSNEDLYNRLTAYMKDFNKKKNYSFILGIQKGGGILYANDSLNITSEVIEGLNQAYENEEKKK